MRTGHVKANKEVVARNLNWLRPSIKEELSLVRMTTIDEAYQFALQRQLLFLSIGNDRTTCPRSDYVLL